MIRQHAKLVVNRRNHVYHVPVDGMVKLTGLIPRRALPAVPSWVRELTYQPTA